MPNPSQQIPLPLTSHNNQSLFSDHYLDDILRHTPTWQTAVTHARPLLNWLRARYTQEQAQLTDYKEAQLEENWFKPIFERLGHVWEVQAAIPGLKNSTKKPDYAFFPDEEARQTAVSHQNTPLYAQHALAIGEVKQWEVNLSKKTGAKPIFDDQNPMYQIDTYLTLTGLEWGILSNGRFWRLLHKSSSRTLETYFEIDLLAALNAPNDTAATAVIAYFWLFFNQTAFRPDAHGRTFLNDALKDSRAYAIELETNLRDNAYRSLEQLIIGFFAGDATLDKTNPAQRLQVYQNSLYLLYRLLFLIYGESRALLPMHNPAYKDHYSLQQLAQSINNSRNTLETQPTTGKRYWNRLGELFRLISGSDPQLNADLSVPRYNGGLFDAAQHPFLEQHFVGDRFLARAIDYLAYRRILQDGGKPAYQAVDYRTLDVRQLGSIYEGMLEYKVAIADEEMVTISKSGVETWVPISQKGKAKTFADRRQPGDLYLTNDKGERKATGSYYTPDYIVEYIVENTLGPLVEQARERVKAQTRQTGSLNDAERQRQSAERFIAEILRLNVLDPAMGSGHFLVEATHYLARALATDDYVQASPAQTGPYSQNSPIAAPTAESDLLYWKRRVVEACIYGVDKNPMAVELAKLSLWLKTAAADKPLSFLDHHLRHGDSLIGAWLDDLSRPPRPQGFPKPLASPPDAQHPLFDESAFTRDINRAVADVMTIERLPSDDIETVHAKEIAWQNIQQTHVARWQTLADLWVSAYFGNDMTPEAYRALADRLQGRENLLTDAQTAQFLAHPAANRQTNPDLDYFHWELAFPEVFFDEYGRSRHAAAGFDAVIGNPPYVRRTAELPAKRAGTADLFVYFFAQGITTLKEGSQLAFISSNSWLRANYATSLRAHLSTLYRSPRCLPCCLNN
ncbi:MAG: Eco57I restriction-modification methylase domain-containing protein [Chloroflexi bacterium]|nr:Eco57I restriction-modification methylase domain-containing protein [Chloroflexota bacterium]